MAYSQQNQNQSNTMNKIEILEIEPEDIIDVGQDGRKRAGLTTEALRALQDAPVAMLSGKLIKNRFGGVTDSLDSVLRNWFDVRR